MHRNLPILGITIALILFGSTFILYTNTYEIQKNSWSDKNNAPNLIIKDLNISTSTEKVDTEKLSENVPETEAKTEEKDEIVLETPPIVVNETIPEPIPEPIVVTPTEEELTFGDINLKTREALVNIFCITEKYHANIAPISGSGTIINEEGVILTNAHIAQYFLLEDYPTKGFVNCLIRTGSPAKAMYKATLLYISPTWISENANSISIENPLGTGEYDFALLLIDEALGDKVLPKTFAFVKPNTKETVIVRDDEVLVGAYPAGFLGAKTIQQGLYASTAITKAMEFYTFKSGSLDVISLGGTVVAQQGSSGGAVVNKKGEMVGLISTSSGGETTADRDLRAISLSHIKRSLIEHNKTTLEELLSGNTTQKATEFNNAIAPTLLQILTSTFISY